MNKEAVDWAKSQLASGFSVDELKKLMLDSGYGKDDIDGILTAAAPQETPEPVAEPVKETPIQPEPIKTEEQPKHHRHPRPWEKKKEEKPAEKKLAEEKPTTEKPTEEKKPTEGSYSAVHYSVEYKETASRLELFIRAIYSIPVTIVLMLLSYLLIIAFPLQWLHSLALGKRNKLLNNVIYKHQNYFAHANSYIMLLTDERPPIIKGVGKLLIAAIVIWLIIMVVMAASAFLVVMPLLEGMAVPTGFPIAT